MKCTATPVRSFNAFYGSRNVCIVLKINCHAFFEFMFHFQYWYFMNSWNQTFVIHSKYFAIFIKILSAPINHEHQVYILKFCQRFRVSSSLVIMVFPYVRPEYPLLVLCSCSNLCICKCGLFHKPKHKP
jgi:hypothetical protein